MLTTLSLASASKNSRKDIAMCAALDVMATASIERISSKFSNTLFTQLEQLVNLYKMNCMKSS
jgi:hypothetical protein